MSAQRPAARARVGAVCLLLFAGSAGWPARAVEPAPVVGLIPAASPEVTRALSDGIRLAFEAAGGGGGTALELVVGEGAGHWSTASAPIVELAHTRGALALISPPERATAHLMAQIGTRSHVPVVSTACADSVTATGSFWVVSVVAACPARADEEPRPPAFEPADPATAPFVHAFHARYGRDPDAWAAAGYDAGVVVVAAVRRGGPTREGLVSALREGFEAPGLAGPIRFDEHGRRAAVP